MSFSKCNISELWKKNEYKEILKSNESEILSDSNLRKDLKEFVKGRVGDTHFPPPVLEIIRCYELCNAIIYGDEKIKEKQSDLDNLCFNVWWETELKNNISSGNIEDVEIFLINLRIECARRLGEEPEYQIFKDAIREKYKCK